MTKPKNQTNREKRNRQIKATLDRLKAAFPGVFCQKAPTPLKVDIHVDILSELDVGKTRLNYALKYYTSNPRYLKTIRPGTERIGLDGKGCGQFISTNESSHAKSRFDSHNTKHKKAPKRRGAFRGQYANKTKKD